MKRKYTSLLLACLMLSAQAWAELTQINGVYQIGTAQDLADFAALVNDGNTWVNAKLTADVAYTENQSIGTSAGGYAGTFDGDGHTITINLSGGTAKGDKAALFKNVYGTVKNLTVAGTIDHNNANPGGVAHYVYGTIRNCVSLVNFTLHIGESNSKNTSCRAGGIAGQVGAGAVVDGCAYYGRMTGNYALWNAGIVGWNSGIVSNCLAIADINTTPSSRSITDGGGGKYNNYYRGTYSDTSSGTLASESDVSDGKMAYIMGLHQTLGTDTRPVTSNQSQIVYAIGSCNASTATSFTNSSSGAAEHSFANSLCTECGAFDYSDNAYFAINTVADYKSFVNYVNTRYPMMNAKLYTDLDLQNYTTSLITYSGTFDGQHHKISNFVVVNTGKNHWGLVRQLIGGTLKNLYMDKTCAITSNAAVGSFVGQILAKGTLIGLGSAATIKGGIDNEGEFTYAGDCGGIVGTAISSCSKYNFQDCWFTGSVAGNKAGFIAGWVGKDCATARGCWSNSNTPAYGAESGKCLFRNSSITLSNCYSVNGTQSGVTTISNEDVSGGRLCYLLNGESSDTPTWFQDLENDVTPTVGGTDIVYAIGELDCGGDPKGSITYSNNSGEIAQDEHSFDDEKLLCTFCHTPKQDAEGYYLLKVPDALKKFADLVNNKGNYSIKARMVSDINMSEQDCSYFPIGTTLNRFTGTFDGQGHKFSNMHLTGTASDFGMFNTGANVTLRDFWLDNTCSITGTIQMGIIGNHSGSNATFEKIGNCGTVSGLGGNVGGLIGGCWGVVSISSCWTTGNVTADNGGNTGIKEREIGAFCGWTNSGRVTFTNCWTSSIVSVTNPDPENPFKESDYVSRCGRDGALVFNNCYSVNGNQANVTKVTTEQLESGELTYKLNGDQSNIVWKQNLSGTADAHPVLDSEHGQVYQNYKSGSNGQWSNTNGAPVASMTLTDMADYAADADFKAESLTYNRTLAKGGYHSLCLPFAIEKSDLPSGSKLFTLSAVGQDDVTLTETSSVEAGVPCFASVTEPFTFGTMSNVEMVASVTNGERLKGTFTEITGAGAVGVYKLDSNGEYFAKTAAVEGDVTEAPVIKPFRSYIAAGSGSVKTLNILLSDGTSLTPTLSEEKEAVIYDLAGRRVTKATKGIYIVNGKKVMK